MFDKFLSEGFEFQYTIKKSQEKVCFMYRFIPETI